MGIVSSAFSRKSSRHGLMTISSGNVCRATHAYSLAIFTPTLGLPLAARTHTHTHKVEKNPLLLIYHAMKAKDSEQDANIWHLIHLQHASNMHEAQQSSKKINTFNNTRIKCKYSKGKLFKFNGNQWIVVPRYHHLLSLYGKEKLEHKPKLILC